eukprot:TRINITY_DN29284_c0_g2_i1.p1 TRINITY_DN29284_c0_g2~~TRINITY_DN29284_c0_g2_i1.p1  ORF type:complete len:256 (+),score=19.45 TRINITY_DN29284_c0_g2_i1:156-923(+)
MMGGVTSVIIIEGVTAIVLASNPNHIAALSLVAFLAVIEKRFDDAFEILGKCIDRASEAHLHCLRGNAHCWVAKSVAGDKIAENWHRQRALEDFSIAYELDAANYDLLHLRGWVYRDMEMWRAAQVDLTAFVDACEAEDPYHDALATVYYDLVNIFSNLSMPDKMRSCWNKGQLAEQHRQKYFGPVTSTGKSIATCLMACKALSVCSFCKSPGAKKLMHCSGCKCTAYCSRACQKNHWKDSHKSECARMGVASDL